MVSLGPAKARHNHADMHRWAELLGVPLRIPPTHPMRTVRALRVLCALPHSRWPQAIEALYAAYWQRGEDVSRDDVIAGALGPAGVRAPTSRPRSRGPTSRRSRTSCGSARTRRSRSASSAHQRGCCGDPAARRCWCWGQDRIAWVEAALAGWDPDAGPPPGGPRPFGGDVEGFTASRTLDADVRRVEPVRLPRARRRFRRSRARPASRPRWHPILLGGLFRDIGTARRAAVLDAERRSSPTVARDAALGQVVGRAVRSPRKFPQRTVTAQRCA